MSTFNIESYLTQLREVVGNNEEKIAKLQLELDNTRASNVELNKYVVSLRDVNTAQVSRIMDLKAALKKNKNDLASVMRQYNKGLETEKAAHLNTHKEVSEVIKQYEETITTLKLERDEYAARFVEVREKLEQENEKYQQLCVDIDSLRGDYRDLEELFDEEYNEESKLRIEELEEQVENDKIRIESLIADVQRLTQKISSIREASDEAMIKIARIRFDTTSV